MGKNDVKFQIKLVFHRIIKNVPIAQIKKYENSMETSVAMATVHEKNTNDTSYKTSEPMLMKFHIKHLHDTKLS